MSTVCRLVNGRTACTLRIRAWRRWGNRIPSAWNRSPIELQKMKITTKSPTEFRQAGTKAEWNYKCSLLLLQPHFCQTTVHVMRSPFSSVCQVMGFVQRGRVCPCSVGIRQALLQGWLLCVVFVCLANVPAFVRRLCFIF